MKTIASSLFCLICLSGFAQNNADLILNADRVQVDRISPENSKTLTVVSSDFAIENLAKLPTSLQDLTIVKVYYIYTSYKQSPSFNQLELDKKRLNELESNIPGILSDPYIEWEIVEQSGCTDFTQGNDFFHGFALIHRAIVTEEERKLEFDQMKAFLENPTADFKKTELDVLEFKELEFPESEAAPLSTENSSANYKGGNYAFYYYLRNSIHHEKISLTRDDIWVEVDVVLDTAGKVSSVEFKKENKKYIQDEVRLTLMEMPNWDPEIENGIPVEAKVKLEIRVSYSRDVNGIYTRNGNRPSFSEAEIETKTGADSEMSADDLEKMTMLEATPVYKSLELLDSEKIALVMDVTASMNAELAALNWWIYNNDDTLRITSYTFFNDGDNMDDRKKKVGQIGGFHQANLIGKITSAIMEAMYAGTGGDGEENDLEAVLFAMNTDSQSEAVLLIADNCSEVRDMSLLSSINKKVHVLVCSKPNIIRLDYLNIAKATGGDIIVNGHRYVISNLQLNDRITIGTATFLYTNKGFEHLSS